MLQNWFKILPRKFHKCLFTKSSYYLTTHIINLEIIKIFDTIQAILRPQIDQTFEFFTKIIQMTLNYTFFRKMSVFQFYWTTVCRRL